MGAKTKIDWCDSTWNPVTGCRYNCTYCYARKIAERFGGVNYEDELENRYGEYDVVRLHAEEDVHELDRPIADFYSGKKAPYPWEFDPTFHRYKLDEPKHWKKPRNIFVCSMADLFGEWVPDEWIKEVFKACEAAPQHRYLFLTKNPKRFKMLRENGIKLPKDCWIGTSVSKDEEEANQYTGRTRYISDNWDTTSKWFVSVEPILERMSRNSLENLTAMHWVIVGAETGRRDERVIPEKKWIDEIAEECKRCGTPIFMKESLRGLMGADFRQEFPWEVSRAEEGRF